MQGQRVLGGNRRPFMCLYLSEMPGSIRNTLGNWINNWICLDSVWLFFLEFFFFVFSFVCVCFLYFGWLSPFGEDVAVLWLHSLWVLFTKRRDMIKQQINVNVSAVFWAFPEHDWCCMLHTYVYIDIYIVYICSCLLWAASYSHSSLLEIISVHFRCISLRSQIIRRACECDLPSRHAT